MIDLNSDRARQDPYPAYEEVRRAGTAVYDSKRNIWYIGRYDNVSEILQNPKLFANRIAGIEPTLSGADGTLHYRSRKILQSAFNTTRIADLNKAIVKLSNNLVENLVNKRECEIIKDLAGQIPASVVIWMMGFENILVEDIRRWTDAIISHGARKFIAENNSKPVTFILNNFRRIKGKRYRNASKEIIECKIYLQEHFMKAKRGHCNGWVTNYLVNSEGDNCLSMGELLDIGFLMIVAGAETTTDLIGNAVLMLVNNPDIQAQLRNHPEFLESFIEEVLRYDSPVQRRPRYTTREIKFDDKSIPKGSHIELLIGSANRDPVQFPDAHRFQLERTPNKHLTFGIGRHFCLGSQLARRESFALLDAMIRKLPLMKLANSGEKIEYSENLTLRGPRRLPVLFG